MDISRRFLAPTHMIATLLKSGSGQRSFEFAFSQFENDEGAAPSAAQTIALLIKGGGTLTYLNRTGRVPEPLTEDEYMAHIDNNMRPVYYNLAKILSQGGNNG